MPRRFIAQLLFSLICGLIIISLSACSSKTPIIRTYSDYVQPISQAGQECLAAITSQLQSCNQIATLTQEQCQQIAKIEAQGAYQQALIDNQQKIGELQIQSYQDIPSKYRGISNAALGIMSAFEPQLNDYVQDNHCQANNGCKAQFAQNFIQCGGTILSTTRCFANCDRTP